MTRKRIAVALSGGVDSSVAMLLLQKAGHEVIGLHMLLSEQAERCIDKIAQLCIALGINHYIFDFRKEFQQCVIDYFCSEYINGRTPNPCIRCNKYFKFGYLLEKALSLDSEYLATGHYARIELRNNMYYLLKGKDPNKDQSYMLYTLSQEQCKHTLFPLGKFSKDEVRTIALENSLPTSEEPSSQDICFTNGNYSDFLSRRVTLVMGDVVDRSGQVLGQHRGIALYTIGQRHGLRLTVGKRLYVIGIESARNRIVVGTEDELYCKGLIARDVNWISGTPPHRAIEVVVKIRYKSSEVTADLHPEPNSAQVKFTQPQRAITPGQAIVFYQNNKVIGGGTIESAM